MKTRAVEIVADVLMGRYNIPRTEVPGRRCVTSNPGTARDGAERVVAALEREGLLARCKCGVGFGHVPDRSCPRHGEAAA